MATLHSTPRECLAVWKHGLMATSRFRRTIPARSPTGRFLVRSSASAMARAAPPHHRVIGMGDAHHPGIFISISDEPTRANLGEFPDGPAPLCARQAQHMASKHLFEAACKRSLFGPALLLHAIQQLRRTAVSIGRAIVPPPSPFGIGMAEGAVHFWESAAVQQSEPR